jgi:hypothetical protein
LSNEKGQILLYYHNVKPLSKYNEMIRGDLMFNLPFETFLWFIPWPFIWVGIALVIYFKMKKDDELENEK